MSALTDRGNAKSGRVLIVDDDAISLNAMRVALCDDFAVETARSGESCLDVLSAFDPDLVLLDIEMDGIDGFETCLRLRRSHETPVIFVSSHDTLDERLQAFDAGGDDFVLKPFDAEVLHRKVQRVAESYQRHRRLVAEKEAAQEAARGSLKSFGETGVLLDFTRSSLVCVDYGELAENLVAAAQEYGLACHALVRHPGGVAAATPRGAATSPEISLLEQNATLGHIFQVRNRLVVNYERVTLVILDSPEDETLAARTRDNIVALAETGQAIAEIIGVRKESALRAETLQAAALESYCAIEKLRTVCRRQQSETRVLLDRLVKQVGEIYVHLGLTDNQEETLSEAIRTGRKQILELFVPNEEFDRQFASIVTSLGLAKSGD